MICVACGENTPDTPCSSCGAEPRLDGRYRLTAVLGQGSSGTTYRAHGPKEELVAIKESILRNAEADKLKELVMREARVLRQLSHPQVPAYIEEIWVTTGRTTSLFLVQQLIPGTDLSELLLAHRYTEEEVLDLLLDLCDVLAYLHGCSPPIVHRDIKPSNLIRRTDGRVVLVDFGSVRDVLKDADIGGSTVAGTFGYMAPEQFAGDASPASDLYALGALAVALLTRKDPAALQAPDRRLNWHAHASVTPGTATLIDALLALEPADRPGSVHELSAQLQRLRDGEQDATDPGLRSMQGAMPRPAPHPSLQTLPAPFADRPEGDEPADFDQHVIPHRAMPPPVAPADRNGLGLAVAVGIFAVVVLGAVIAGFIVASSDSPSVPWDSHSLPWPSMTADELASLPPDPTCTIDVSSQPGVTAETRCAEPLRNIAEQQVRHHHNPDSKTIGLAVSWAPRPPDAYIVETESHVELRPEGPFYTPPTDAQVDPIRWIRPSYPPEAEAFPLANITCDLVVDVGMDGRPDAISVSGCPTPFHGTAVHTAEQLRWDPPKAPAQVRVGYAYSKSSE